MYRTWIIGFLLTTTLLGFSQTRKQHTDYVPDERTATQIAEAVLVAKFGESRVKAQLPLRADGTDKDSWEVRGKIVHNRKGGGFEVWINKHSGCIGKIVETK